MINKTLGYILGGVGIILFALSYPAIRTMLNIPAIPADISDIYITLLGVVLLIAGAYIAFKSPSSKQPKEIPIYEGHGKKRKIVGLQRLKD